MSGCCDHGCSLERLHERQHGSLCLVLGINAVVFLVIVVVGQIGYRLCVPRVSLFEIMDASGALGLAANSICLLLLGRHRCEDVNMRALDRLGTLAAVAVVWSRLYPGLARHPVNAAEPSPPRVFRSGWS